jgi:hypothetical protein
MNYYSPYKAYCVRSHIYNFLPHPGESIAQAWRRLKGLLLKNPNHRFSQGIILINFYVWLDKPYKELIIFPMGVSHIVRLRKHVNYWRKFLKTLIIGISIEVMSQLDNMIINVLKYSLFQSNSRI